MMELRKKKIMQNLSGKPVFSQMTLDEDFNVPDSMDDMEELILENGEIRMENVKNRDEKVEIDGKLIFRVLYRRPGGGLLTLAGMLPFEETLNLPGLPEQGEVRIRKTLDDLSITMIHSRKLSVRALVTFQAVSESEEEKEAACDAVFDGKAEVLKTRHPISHLAVRRKDTYRIRETISLSANKPDLGSLLWQNVKLQDLKIRGMDEKIRLEGKIRVFTIYSGEEAEDSVWTMEETVPFSGELECPGAREGMIPFITSELIQKELQIMPDLDGEMRELSLDAVMELTIRLYEEEEGEFLTDLYALDRDLILEEEKFSTERIFQKTTWDQEIRERIKLDENGKILQICDCDGELRLDGISVGKDEVTVDGIFQVTILYLTEQGESPVEAEKAMFPFHAEIAMPGIPENAVAEAEPGIREIHAEMTAGDRAEVHAGITLELLVTEPYEETIVSGIREEPPDMEKLRKMPGITGYHVRPGDTLWKIARTYHTSVDEIMKVNGLTDSTIYPGDSLLLVKELPQEP